MHVATEPAPELALPALDWAALARRAALPAAAAIALVVGVIVAGGPLQAFADALDRALRADPAWVVAGAAFELLSFGGYVALLWLVGRRATARLGVRESAEITLGGAAATRLLPSGGLGGVALTIWALRRAGLGARGAARALLAFLVVLYAVFLGSIAVSGWMLATGIAGNDGPLVLSAIPAVAATLAIVGGLALAARHRDDSRRAAPAPAGASRAARVHVAFRNVPVAVGTGVRDALALVRSADPRLLGALAWWGFDAAVLWAMFQAFGAPPALAVVVLGYFVGQVANTIPVPGAVSGGMVGVFLAFGVEADLALASVLAYRAVAIWLPAPIGVAALGSLRGTIARWGREDAAASQDAAGRRPHPLPVRPRTEAPLRVAA